MSIPFQTVHLQETPNDETFDERCYLAVNPDVARAVEAGKIASGWAHFKKFGRIEGRRQKTPDDELTTSESFDEEAYLASNPDALAAVSSGSLASARAHFDKIGRAQKRRQRRTSALPAIRAEKIRKLTPLLSSAPRLNANGKLDYLTDEARRTYSLTETDLVSENNYDDETISLIEQCEDGLLLDVGAGARPSYYSNVVNYEVVDYPTTDVLGVAEELPFKDACFDGIISIAVLEHVRNPFRCAAEMARVLKPGGWLKCCAPFLQPLHGYPNHYFNMTHEGLRVLFEPFLTIERQEVTPPTHPVWAIAWQLRSWANGLPPKARKQFLRARVSELIEHPAALLEKPWARELPRDKQFELAAATILIGRKPERR